MIDSNKNISIKLKYSIKARIRALSVINKAIYTT